MRLGVSTGFETKNVNEWINANTELKLGSVVFPLNAYIKIRSSIA